LALVQSRLGARQRCVPPILFGDRPVVKLDATADRAAGVLRVRAIHQDVAFTKAVTAAVDHECRDLARWLGLELAPPA